MKLLCVYVFLVGVVHCDFTSEDESDNVAYYGFEIYRKISNASENLVFSPLSFRVLYSILYQVSFGESQNELQHQLFTNIHNVCKKHILSTQSKTLDRILNSTAVKLANKVYLAEGAAIKDDFKLIVTQYKSDVEQVNFSEKDDVANKMNHWIEQKTNSLIKNLINADSVTPDTALFLINTLYFKAQWRSPYTQHSLSNETFNNVDGSKSQIEFVVDEDDYNIASSDELKVDVLQLNYEEKSNFIFWIIVPRIGSCLCEIKSKLNPDFIHKISSSFNWAYSKIKFPTFTIESGADGRNISKALFAKAELNMLENSRPLKVDEIKQKTKITVNTFGTEAASSTYFKIVPETAYFGEAKTFSADRPFLFAVLTEDHKEPIFIGHYVNAKK